MAAAATMQYFMNKWKSLIMRASKTRPNCAKPKATLRICSKAANTQSVCCMIKSASMRFVQHLFETVRAVAVLLDYYYCFIIGWTCTTMIFSRVSDCMRDSSEILHKNLRVFIDRMSRYSISQIGKVKYTTNILCSYNLWHGIEAHRSKIRIQFNHCVALHISMPPSRFHFNSFFKCSDFEFLMFSWFKAVIL